MRRRAGLWETPRIRRMGMSQAGPRRTRLTFRGSSRGESWTAFSQVSPACRDALIMCLAQALALLESEMANQIHVTHV